MVNWHVVNIWGWSLVDILELSLVEDLIILLCIFFHSINMSNSMRWPLISLVGQAPVCQALEKFRGNLCHLDARGRSFCTPRMYICLLRAILPWCPCLHSFFLLLFLSPQFYVQLNRILYLHCWGALAISYSMCAVLCSHWGMFENTTLQTWFVLSTSLNISFSCSV